MALFNQPEAKPMAMSKKVAGKAANGKTKTVAAVASPAKKKPAKKA